MHQGTLMCTREEIKCKTSSWPLNTCSWTLHPLLWCANPPEALHKRSRRWTGGGWGWQHQHSCPWSRENSDCGRAWLQPCSQESSVKRKEKKRKKSRAVLHCAHHVLAPSETTLHGEHCVLATDLMAWRGIRECVSLDPGPHKTVVGYLCKHLK